MLCTAQLAIIFDCEVADSGYTYLDSRNGDQISKETGLIESVMSEEKLSKRVSGRNILVQRVKKQIPRIKPFTYEAVQDFIALGSHYSDQRFHDERICFYDKWGPLIRLREDDVTFRKALNILLECENAKSQSEFPAFDFGADPLKKENQSLSWDYDSAERLIPAFRPTSLFNSIYLAWGLTAQSERVRKICKYFRIFGPRKNCNHYFQDTRGNREFCSRNCSNAFRQKPNWQQKVRRDIDIRLKKSRIKLDRVNKEGLKTRSHLKTD